MSARDHIVRWYFERDFERADFDFDDYLVDAIVQTTGKNIMSSELYADVHSDMLWDSLKIQIADELNRGLYPTFSQVAPGVKRLFWHAKFLPHDISKGERHRRTRLLSRNQVTKSIRELDYRQFEALCVLACRLSGASRYTLTPHSDEFGIDFFAVIPSVGKSHVFNGGGGPIRIVGQSKMHSAQVARDYVVKLTAAVTSVQQRSEDVRTLIPNWFVRESGPIVGWFVAHNGLHSGAQDYANSFGIIHSDSRDLAEIITMSRAWQPSEGVQAPVELIHREIEEILSQ